MGTQYRSVILYRDENQKRVAEEVIGEINAARIWDRPIVTELAPFKAFYAAEDYHQEYFAHNGHAPYCQVVIAPKVQKFRTHFTSQLKQ
jgi:peptide methionine sulfoxide reductase MsrA